MTIKHVLLMALGASLLPFGAIGQSTPASVTDGVYTTQQAERGALVHRGACAGCHGAKLDGASQDPDRPSAPPIAGPRFLRKWDGQSLVVVFELTRATMPKNNPGGLTDQQYADALAHMLAVSGLPAGDKELPSDPAALAGITIKPVAN